MGEIVVKLYNDTPQHRDNFVKLVNSGYYDGLLFHRVIKDFMIQGGDPDSRQAKPRQALGSGGPGYTIPAEFVSAHFHKKGALAAARQGDHMQYRRSKNQPALVELQEKLLAELKDIMRNEGGFHFSQEQKTAYTTVGGAPHLDGDYTVFGEVVEGFDVLDLIEAVPTQDGDRPEHDIKMSMKVLD